MGTANVGEKVATIAINTSLSDAVDLQGTSVIGILMPAAWTTADLTFQGSSDGVTYGNIYDEKGAEVTSKAAAAVLITLTSGYLKGLNYIKVRSGTGSSAVNQAAARSIKLIVK